MYSWKFLVVVGHCQLFFNLNFPSCSFWIAPFSSLLLFFCHHIYILLVSCVALDYFFDWKHTKEMKMRGSGREGEESPWNVKGNFKSFTEIPDNFVTQLDSSREFFNFTLIASSLVTVNGMSLKKEAGEEASIWKSIKKYVKNVPCFKGEATNTQKKSTQQQ